MAKQKTGMEGIEVRRNRKGEIRGYKFRCCVGRNAERKQVWRTTVILPNDPRIEGKTPAATVKALSSIKTAWDEQQKSDYKNGNKAADKAHITFADFVRSHWWKDHVMDGEHTPSTISFYQHMSDDILSYFGEKKRLSQIGPEDVKRFIVYLKKDARTRKGEPYSQCTIQHHYRTLVNILDYARRMEYITASPCSKLSAKEKPRKDSKKIDFMDSDEAQEFMRCLEMENEPESLFWRCFMNLLITTGLRRGEAVGLQWSDISSDNLTITVQRNVTMDKDADNKLHIGPPKNGEPRTVPISRRVYGMLAALRAKQENDYGCMMPNAYIFNRPGNPYLPINPTEPTRWQRRFVKRHGLKNVSPHDLRHTAATLALEGGADLKQVQELLGHKDPETTMQFYAGVSEKQQRKTVEAIESMIV